MKPSFTDCVWPPGLPRRMVAREVGKKLYGVRVHIGSVGILSTNDRGETKPLLGEVPERCGYTHVSEEGDNCQLGPAVSVN